LGPRGDLSGGQFQVKLPTALRVKVHDARNLQPTEAAVIGRTAIALVSLIAVTAILRADEPASRPAHEAPTQAKTTDEIIKIVDGMKGFGCLQTAQFDHWGHRVFAVWYCPFSGRGDCFLHAYYYDYDKAQWTRFVDQLVPAGGDLSVQLTVDDNLVFQDSTGKSTVKQSLSKLPQKKWW